MMGDDSAFLREALDVLGLLLHKAERNEERKIGVLVPGRLEHRVQCALHVFPDAVAPWFDHHAATHIRWLGQIAGANDLLIPFGEILFAPWCDGSSCWVGLGHFEARI